MMTAENPHSFQRGDLVRDLAGLGGTVLWPQPAGCYVHWNNGERNWIDVVWLRHNEKADSNKRGM